MFRIRVQATNEEFALISKAAQKQGLSAPQFVTRSVRNLGKKRKAPKLARPRPTSPEQKNSPRRKRRS